MLAFYLRPATGFALPVSAAATNPSISLSMESSSSAFPPEDYSLRVREDGIDIRASSGAGLFHGVQSLRQLLPPEIFSPEKLECPWVIPACRISDRPRFAWRGLMLDEGRHWYRKDYVKKFIELLALHKYNIFHWHLTENAGWRIEIKRYPRLQEVAAWRRCTVIGHMSQPEPLKYDNEPYGGYYTQDEVREIVKYAADRYITVIPEIEMPAHCQAALAAYPELGCTGGPYEVMCRWGYSYENFCAGNDAVFEFLQNVLDEVCELFPSKHIHIGGDECKKDAWENCPKCQKRMRDEKIADTHQLQSYFIRRIEHYLRSKGRLIVGWDEILEGGGLDPNAVVMVWLEKCASFEAAAKMGNPVVAALHKDTYFDYYQGNPATEPLAIGGYLPLSKVYAFDPVPQDSTPERRKAVMGLQGQIWSQYIKTASQLEYMTFPRAAALAEGAWSALENKDYEKFFKRLALYFKRLEFLGVNYRQPEPPGQEWNPEAKISSGPLA
ncbi:MAG: hypothetical protein A2X49_11125 [Lentisphaerae bacterium GWF2_52_8]|nr:MAG: hypothetical protein A2X49_11125 [Lentisphaerae bacterium GWF2_52_8]